jgi:predicted dehydrogenase
VSAATETRSAPAAARGARRRIGVGVIGFGWLGQAHSRSLLRIPTLFAEREFDTELVVCGDTLPERREDAVRSFGFGRSTADWRAVIDDPGVDVVFVAALTSRPPARPAPARAHARAPRARRRRTSA